MGVLNWEESHFLGTGVWTPLKEKTNETANREKTAACCRDCMRCHAGSVNTFQLFSTGAGLALVKTAWMTSDGSPITSGSTVPQGTYVDFMIYVNNKGSVAINDVSIRDVLDPLFVYQADSIRVDNSVADCAAAACDAAEEAAIYAAASAVLPTNSDGVDADTSSFAGVTVDAGNENVANGQLNAAADSVLAVVFTVQVQ
jgi:uncharacterized repeat protein (TIGR01451 family)